MPLQLKRIVYKKLKSRQKENYNFQKVSAVFADFGFATIRLSDDWCGADFIAQHIDGVTFYKVQLKGRLTFSKKYQHRNIYICFPSGGQWFLYPHDELLRRVRKRRSFFGTISWSERGGYSFRDLSEEQRAMLKNYRLGL